MSKHTPGPLTVHGPSTGIGPYDDGGDYAILDIQGKIIGEVIHRVDKNDYRDAEANAQLWAKAPDLVAALKPFAALYAKRLDEMDDDVPLYQHCDAVIRVGDVRQARAVLADCGAKMED